MLSAFSRHLQRGKLGLSPFLSALLSLVSLMFPLVHKAKTAKYRCQAKNFFFLFLQEKKAKHILKNIRIWGWRIKSKIEFKVDYVKIQIWWHMNFSNLIYKLSLSNIENEVFEVSTSFVYTKVITQQSVNKHF